MELSCHFQPDLIDPSAYLAAGARVVGNVSLAQETSVWFNAVLRGDAAVIQIGARTNIQDNCVLHADPGFPCTLGHDVTVGHGAIVHGATIGDRVMIGMRAVVMNGATVGNDCLIAVGSVVTEGVTIPAGSLVMGLPGKVVRPLTAAEIDYIRHAAAHYVTTARAFAAARE